MWWPCVDGSEVWLTNHTAIKINPIFIQFIIGPEYSYAAITIQILIHDLRRFGPLKNGIINRLGIFKYRYSPFWFGIISHCGGGTQTKKQGQ
jgi:hypothetical protein